MIQKALMVVLQNNKQENTIHHYDLIPKALNHYEENINEMYKQLMLRIIKMWLLYSY